MSLRIVLAAAAALLLASDAHAAPRPVPLLDAHTHLMIENLTADEEIALLKKAGVDRVLLMHTDPDALAALARKYPGFVIPSLSLARPNVKGLHLDADTGPLMLRLRQARQSCGFGEIPGFIFGDNPDFRSIYAAAAATGAPVNIHTDLARPENIAALEAAASAFPKAHLVLAHLGWTAGPDLIGRLLDAHPNLYTDVSIRFEPPGSLPWRNNGLDLSILTADRTLQPGWRAVIERHPDRFLFAMDINSFGPRYTITDELVATARTALAPLPRRIQQAIGHANAERLLAGCRP